MSDEREEPLSEDERRSLADLPDRLDPPAHLESRIASDLQARGLLNDAGVTPGRQVTRTMLLTAAAVLAAFAGGWISRGWTAAEAAPGDTEPRYMLLLYGAGSTPGEEPRRVSEYRAWAGSIASSGAHVSGEKLDDRAMLLGAEPGAQLEPSELGGFFIVSARDDYSVVALARTHPHLKYGGRVLIRPISP